MTDPDPRCQKCGHPRSNHPYRHMFVGPSKPDTVGTRADLANPLDDPRVKALVEAATELHDKAVEKHQRHRSDIWPVIRKLRAALSALEENK